MSVLLYEKIERLEVELGNLHIENSILLQALIKIKQRENYRPDAEINQIIIEALQATEDI
tara:strand:- start:36 stop:215 length:180 start_codon:yes stop_codon:yes gene_type:complete